MEVNCETDFVARGDKFKELVNDLAMQIAASDVSMVAIEDAPADEVERERAIEMQKDDIQSKPEQIRFVPPQFPCIYLHVAFLLVSFLAPRQFCNLDIDHLTSKSWRNFTRLLVLCKRCCICETCSSWDERVLCDLVKLKRLNSLGGLTGGRLWRGVWPRSSRSVPCWSSPSSRTPPRPWQSTLSSRLPLLVKTFR